MISDDPFVMQLPQDIRQQIDQDVDANRIASHLIELPRCIHDQQVQVAELRKAVDTAKGELLNEEALLAAGTGSKAADGRGGVTRRRSGGRGAGGLH